MKSTLTEKSGFTAWPVAFANQYKDAGYWRDQTLPQMLDALGKEFSDNVALIQEGREWTYQELDLQVKQLASGFQRTLGLKANDKVVLHLPNIGEFYVCFFALLRLGVQPILALPAHRYSELHYFCEFGQVKALLTAPQSGADIAVIAEKISQNLDHECRLIWAGSKDSTPNKGVQLSSLYSDIHSDLTLEEQEFAFFQLSGGTTGTPKLIPRTHADYLYSVRTSNQVCLFSSETRYLCVLPAAHNFSLSSPGALGCFMAGGTVVLSADASPQTAFKLIEQHKITVAALVPPLALLWLDEAGRSKRNIRSLEVLQVGGARFSKETAKRIKPELRCTLQQVFGMAEGLVNYTRLDDPEEIIVSSQGRPMSVADEIKVLNSNGDPVPVGSPGILFTRGPYTIRGYYNAPQHNQRSFTEDGFYRTGDVVALSHDGYIKVVGRDKEQINRGGEKIAAQEIENHLLANEKIHDAALIAIPDDFLGERSCAALVCLQPLPKAIEIKRFLRSRGLADFKIPDRIIFVDSLPKTPVGKVNKKKLLELI